MGASAIPHLFSPPDPSHLYSPRLDTLIVLHSFNTMMLKTVRFVAQNFLCMCGSAFAKIESAFKFCAGTYRST